MGLLPGCKRPPPAPELSLPLALSTTPRGAWVWRTDTAPARPAGPVPTRSWAQPGTCPLPPGGAPMSAVQDGRWRPPWAPCWSPRRSCLPFEAPAPGRPRCPVGSGRPPGASSQQRPALPGTSCSSWGGGASPCPAPASPQSDGCLHSAPGGGEARRGWDHQQSQDPKGAWWVQSPPCHRHKGGEREGQQRPRGWGGQGEAEQGPEELGLGI